MDSNTWREKLANETNFSQKIPYSYINLINNIEAVNLDLDNIKPFEFLSVIYEFTRGFKSLSSSVSMAFSDISEKIEIWRKLFLNEYPEAESLQQVMEKEIELNIHILNGDNNNSHGHKKKTKYHSYISGSRTIIRLSWFMNFLIHVFKKLLSTELPFNKLVVSSYDEVLAPKHTWFVRKAAGVAFNLAPSKRSLAYKVFFGKDYTYIKIKF
jgi:hypothetical protein